MRSPRGLADGSTYIGAFESFSRLPPPESFPYCIAHAVDSGVYRSNGTEWLILAGSVTVKPNRSANFNLAAADNNSIIPCDATLTATLTAAAALDINFTAELKAVAAATVTLAAGSGATLIVAGESAANVAVTEEGSSIIVTGSGTPNKFYAYKIGA